MIIFSVKRLLNLTESLVFRIVSNIYLEFCQQKIIKIN